MMFKTVLETGDYAENPFTFIGYGVTMREADNEIVRQVSQLAGACSDYDAKDMLDGEWNTFELSQGVWIL